MIFSKLSYKFVYLNSCKKIMTTFLSIEKTNEKNVILMRTIYDIVGI